MRRPLRSLYFSTLLVLMTFFPFSAVGQSERKTIMGTVVNETGDPISGALIQFMGMDVSRDLRMMTDRKGVFYYMVPLGKYRVVCRARGYMPDFVEGIKVPGDSDPVEVNFRLKPGEDRKLPFELSKEEIPRPKERQLDSYLIVGFSRQESDADVLTGLEGVLSQEIYGDSATIAKVESFWSVENDSKSRKIYEQKTPVKRAFYLFSVPSGKFSLSGFIETLQPRVTYKFDKFVHSYEIPSGKAVYIGSFHLGKLVTKISVNAETFPEQILGSSQVSVYFDKEAYEWIKSNLKEIDGHEIVISPSVRIN